MEFYIHNKDDNKLTTAVNLATQFKLEEENYIIYYNTQVEKSSIDIYIGQISYGNKNLIITKIAPEKQNEFLNVIKDILAGNNPETEQSDYANIIDTATIVLDSVQKIQIPTKSLEILTKYHNPSIKEEKQVETANNEVETTTETSKEDVPSVEEKTTETPKEDVPNEEEKTEENKAIETTSAPVEKKKKKNIIDTDLSSLDSLINQNDSNKKEKQEKIKEKSNKAINTPLLVLLIITIIGGAIYFIYNYLIK